MNNKEYLEKHKLLDYYYYVGWGDGKSLVFTKEWREKHLPPNGDTERFNVLLLDRTDNKTYETKLYVAYENHQVSILDEDYNAVMMDVLMGYFYGSHHCPCHRMHDAKKAGAIVESNECEGNRFIIRSITCDAMPDLILYSEEYSIEELEEKLMK